MGDTAARVAGMALLGAMYGFILAGVALLVYQGARALTQYETLRAVSVAVVLAVAVYAALAVVLCGAVAIQRGAHRRGARLLGAVNPQSLRRSWLFRYDPRAYEESLAAARAALGEPDFAAVTAEGGGLTLAQAIASALEGDGG